MWGQTLRWHRVLKKRLRVFFDPNKHSKIEKNPIILHMTLLPPCSSFIKINLKIIFDHITHNFCGGNFPTHRSSDSNIVAQNCTKNTILRLKLSGSVRVLHLFESFDISKIGVVTILMFFKQFWRCDHQDWASKFPCTPEAIFNRFMALDGTLLNQNIIIFAPVSTMSWTPNLKEKIYFVNHYPNNLLLTVSS